MIAITPLVLQWYQQRKAPIPTIFEFVASNSQQVSINHVINLNAGWDSYPSNNHMTNTLALLRLRRKRGTLTLDSLYTMQRPHQVVGYRIARAWERANGRKSV